LQSWRRAKHGARFRNWLALWTAIGRAIIIDMIHYILEHLAFLEGQLSVLDEGILLEINEAGFRPALELIKTVPGIQQDSAVSVLWLRWHPTCLSFPSASHLSF
jgi:hypothetical protein